MIDCTQHYQVVQVVAMAYAALQAHQMYKKKYKNYTVPYSQLSLKFIL